MQLAFAFLSRAAERSRAGTIDAYGAGFETLELGHLPVPEAPITLVAKFRCESGESGQEHELAIDLTSPDGSRSHLASERIIPGESIDHRKQPCAATVVTTLDAAFERGGDHVFHLLLDGEQVATLPLRVVLTCDDDATKAMQMRGLWMRQLGMSEEEIAELCNTDSYPANIEEEAANVRALERMRSSKWSV
jgi:hypothetical protein